MSMWGVGNWARIGAVVLSVAILGFGTNVKAVSASPSAPTTKPGEDDLDPKILDYVTGYEREEAFNKLLEPIPTTKKLAFLDAVPGGHFFFASVEVTILLKLASKSDENIEVR